MLTTDERARLFHLAGETVAPGSQIDRDVPEGILHLLACITEIPAHVIDAKYDILAWNHLATPFIGDPSQPGVERNMQRWIVHSPNLREYLCDDLRSEFIRSGVTDLRAVARWPRRPACVVGRRPKRGSAGNSPPDESRKNFA